MAIYWPTPGFKGRTFKLCVLIRWDFYFCVRSSPLLGFSLEVYQINDVFTALMTWNFWFTSGPDSRCKCTGPRCKLSVSGPSSRASFSTPYERHTTQRYTTRLWQCCDSSTCASERRQYTTKQFYCLVTNAAAWCRAHSPTHSHQSLKKWIKKCYNSKRI